MCLHVCVYMCLYVCAVLSVHTLTSLHPPVILYFLLHPEDGGNPTDHIVRSNPDPHLLPRLAAPSSSTFKLHHHDGDVIGAAAVERLEDDTLGAEVRLVQTLTDKPHRLLVAEGVPQAVGCQDHELWLQFVQVKGHDIRIGNDYIEVFQRVVPQGTGHC